MFLEGVKEACTGAPDTPMVLLGNFAVEDEWARGEVGLPALGSRAAAAVAHRMDEFALLLGGPGDHVVLKSAPDPGFLDQLRGLGLDLPQVLVPEVTEPGRSVSEDVLTSPALLATLRELGAAGARLWPHGMSALEERICARTGLASALPGAAVAKAVNGKIYSRRLADELGIRQVRGWECETVAQFAAAAGEAAAVLAAGGRIGVKDAYGVSGKGIAVVDDPARLDRLVTMVTRRAERSGDERVALVVEEWAAKETDLTCHFTLARDGSVRFDFVKEALIAQGVSVGHRMPARLTPAHLDTVEECAHALGKRLAADGYHGVVGVDAMIEQHGGLLPVVEINARNNMATYQTRLQERFVPEGAVALARQYRLRLCRPLAFDELRERLDGLLLAPGRDRGSGLLVDGFATVNAAHGAHAPGEPFTGRLHALVIGGSQAEVEEWDAAVVARLGAFGARGGTA
ncbi:ATP-grasp domain-containing protein [Streptacidiphilus jiangxiensis]|uniref:ATP-grasp domain-containing protein n=1 Tax=Streptacidiphilus jiangxiensis TaxID=235985 RepID=A0A1H7JK13_STRJI|nr:ATP-grasp domain-containing protein [Streptacidiphilus jiangxiensis]SEK74217.1 ATP-grasp domain-containing protein [Streptacidiphilus jiangxiensis]